MKQFVQCIATGWLNRQLYGWKFAPSIANFDYPYIYLKAMLYIAGADTLDVHEKRQIQGHIEVLLPKMDSDIMTFVENYAANSPAPIAPSSFISGTMLTSPVLARVLLYDAVRAAFADGVYAPKERDHVYNVGKQLGIPDTITYKIETIAERELAVTRKKRRLLLSGVTSKRAAERAKRENTRMS